MPHAGTIPQIFPHHSTGATLVSFGSNPVDTSGETLTLLPLGYCEDRVQIEERPQWEDIRNDIFGGMAGIPSEVQYLGSVVYVHCNLNRFVLNNLRELSSIHPVFSELVAGLGGVTPGPMGTFMRQGNNVNETYMEMLELSCATQVLTFSRAFLRQGKRFNMGVRHQQIALVFECHVSNPCDMELYEIAAGNDPCA
jgi:hypothetical protein